MAYPHPTEKSMRNLRPAKKGEVRNPLGINRKRPWTDRMLEKSEELLALSEDGEAIRVRLKLSETATWADAAVYMLMRRAVRGEPIAIKELADRIEGKAVVRIADSGANSGIRILVIDRSTRPKRDEKLALPEAKP